MVSRLRYETYACLNVSGESGGEIARFLTDNCGVPQNAIQTKMHLTVYHSVIPLIPMEGLIPERRAVNIRANADETRFMVFTIGGEVKREGIEPADHSVGIRLTRRNQAIGEIQSLRESIYRLEEKTLLGTRERTSAWKNSFGPRQYQPHIKLLLPGSRIDSDLTIAGQKFRDKFESIEFDEFVVEIR